MENKLKVLFDFQRFQNNSRLAQMISQTEIRFDNILDDDDLSLVSAAGEFTPKQCRKGGDDFDT